MEKQLKKTVLVRLPQSQWDRFIKLLSQRPAFPENASDSLKCTYAIGIAICLIQDQIDEIKGGK